MSNEKSIEQVEISKLEFDRENPRLPIKYHKASEKEVIEWMLEDASLTDLMSSIAQNGFFYGEPILVTPNKKNGKLTVVEGNRRLAAVKVLNNPILASSNRKQIEEIIYNAGKGKIENHLPVVIFTERKQINDYLGYRHITGVESWGPLAKSRYLNALYKELPKSLSLKDKLKLLAKKIGSRSDYVQQLLVSYSLYELLEEEKFFKIYGLNEETIDFSNLYDSIRFSGIQDFLGINLSANDELKSLNKKNFSEFCHWLYEKEQGQTRLGENRNLRILNKVVSSENALKQFRGGKSLKDASNYTDLPEENFSKNIMTAYTAMQEALNLIPRISKKNAVDLENLKAIQQFSEMMTRAISEKK